MTVQNQHRTVIIGGGFGGLTTAKHLNKTNTHVTLIDRRNFHLFQPLLYQVATGALSPANIAAPLRAVLKRQKNTEVLLGEVRAIDPASKTLQLDDETIPYDTLVVATGVAPQYFGNTSWEAHAPSLKTIEEATAIRAQVLSAFEVAEREIGKRDIQPYLTFVVIGAGPTGVELAGALAEISQHTLQNNFRRIDPANARIILIEAGPRVLPSFPESLSEYAKQDLIKMGVDVQVNTKVLDIRENEVIVQTPQGEESITTETVLWAAGVKVNGLGKQLAEVTDAPVDRMGRLIVEPDLSLPNMPDIYVIGDLAHFEHGEEAPLPGLAPVAIQQAHYVAKAIHAKLNGTPHSEPFKYFDKGTMATIGRASAVVNTRWFKLTGFFGWLTWLFIHLMYIVEFEARTLVLWQWAWNYLTRNRAARLITGENRVENQPAQIVQEAEGMFL